MKKGKLISLYMFIFLLITPSSLLANDDKERIGLLRNAKSLKCSFDSGVFSHWENGKFTSEKDTTFKPIIFDSINFQRGEARVLGREGSADALATLTMGGAHFVESTKTGGWNTTSVFLVYGKKGEEMFQRGLFFAVHSRHISVLLSQPLLSQYYGTCELWNID